jgi:cysteinyl-tRNA synthetase
MKTEIPEDVQALIDARVQARADKNWAEADRIRDELASRGIILEDTKDGVKVLMKK